MLSANVVDKYNRTLAMRTALLRMEADAGSIIVLRVGCAMSDADAGHAGASEACGLSQEQAIRAHKMLEVAIGPRARGDVRYSQSAWCEQDHAKLQARILDTGVHVAIFLRACYSMSVADVACIGRGYLCGKTVFGSQEQPRALQYAGVICLRACYEMSGAELMLRMVLPDRRGDGAYNGDGMQPAISLRARYAMSGTEMATLSC